MAKTLAFIPARCGSKSIRLKNVRPFCGRPLLYWSLESLEEAPSVDEVVVATDCEEIAEVTRGFGFAKTRIYLRDPANAADASSTESAVLEYIDREGLSPDDLFILVQCTSPFTRSHHVEDAVRQFADTGADSLLSCALVRRFLWNRDGTPINYDYSRRPRRQEFEGTLMENGAFYISTVGRIVSSGNRLSGKISVYEMPDYTSLELDEEDDWLVGERLMYRHVLGAKPGPAPKLFVSDVDGVLTDAGMYYDNDGNEWKKFNTHDGKGFELLRQQGIKTAIVTSEDTRIVDQRARKLRVDFLHQGVADKLPVVREMCTQLGISLEEVAYVGDDINDRNVLEVVGHPACPANALPVIRSIPGIHLLSKAGGSGAVREFVEYLLEHQDRLDGS